MKISAAVLRGPEDLYSIEELDLPEPDAGQILVRIVASGFCHTDAVPRRAPADAAFKPLVTGHEGAGIVERVGADVSNIVVGDHIILSYDSCGECARCLAEQPFFCDHFVSLNIVGADQQNSSTTDAGGGSVRTRWFGQSSFATYAIANVRNSTVVDKDLPLETLCPLGCGIQTGAGTAANIFGIVPGQSLVVFGTGGVGMAAIMMARALGADTIIAVDLKQGRLDTARECGATHTVLAGTEDVETVVAEAAPGGVDFSFDTTGRPDILLQAVNCIRQGGVCAQVGGTKDLVIPAVALNGKMLTRVIEGNAVPQKFIPQLIGLWRDGLLPLERIIKTFPLADINAAEQASADGSVIKPVIVPRRA